MRLVRFIHDERIRIGKVVNDYVIDLTDIVGSDSMRAAITMLPELTAAMGDADGPSWPLADVELLAPITDPQKFLAIGMNYGDHAKEATDRGMKLPDSQFWFNKQVSCIVGPFDDVVFPAVETRLDYEAELGVIIGKRVRRVKAADARAVIAGYVVINDVSARDWQTKTPTFTLGKSFDTHGPLGPWIVTDDEIADPHDLNMRLTVNGEPRQATSTGDMLFNIYEQIEYLSTVMTLEPGDILATGTPAGVGIVTDRLLKIGDVVRVEIDGIGAIENHIIADVAIE